jgi:endo-1,4-beta-xylanase
MKKTNRSFAMQQNLPAAAALAASVLLSAVAGAQLPESYLKKWDDPAVQKRIDDGIEKNRKSDVELTIVDVEGKPVSGAEVKVAQESQEFLFGANIFVLGQLKEREQAYREAFLRLFNAATAAFYWGAIEPEQGKLRYAEGGEDIWRRPPPDRVVAFAKEHGLTLRGHPLLWFNPRYNPKWMPWDPAALKDLYRQRFQQIAERYAGDILIWDTVNESQANMSTRGGAFPLSVPEEGNFQSYVPWAFSEADKVFRKDNELHINELSQAHWLTVNGENPYYQLCRQLIADGTRIDGIGFQFHFFDRERLDAFLNEDRSDPDRLLNLYEQFAGLGRPLHITEITIGSQGEEGEALQERVVRDMYRLWFSVPKMAGITWWNLGDGMADGKEGLGLGGLTDEKIKPKPAYRALDQLINHDWKTNLQTRSDEDGKVKFRGFHGGYKVTVTAGGTTKEFEVKASGDGATKETLTMP